MAKSISTISKELVYQNGKLMVKGKEVETISGLTITQLFTGLVFTGAGNLTLFRTAADKGRFHLTKIDIIPTKVTACTATPVLNVGTVSPDFADLGANLDLSGLNATGQFFAIFTNGLMPTVAPNTDIIIRKITPATATEYVATVRMLGYYLS